MDLIIRQQRLESDGVMSMILESPDGEDLAEWQPGAHLDIVLNSGLVRQYSLCSDPANRKQYRVAILKELRGRGGSKEVHEQLRIGDTLRVRGPKNHFAMAAAEKFLFIAGGIGITPILVMVREAERQGTPWTLIYGGRSRSSMAFLSELDGLTGGTVAVVPQDELGIPDLQSALSSCSGTTGIYCCGPEGLLRAVDDLASQLGHAEQLHTERFAASTETKAKAIEVEAPADPADESEGLDEFEVELTQSNCVLRVPADRTILDVVREVNPDVLFDCEDGYCGTCETAVLGGIPDHRDTILTPSEKEKGATMMICVGRSKSSRLILDA